MVNQEIPTSGLSKTGKVLMMFGTCLVFGMLFLAMGAPTFTGRGLYLQCISQAQRNLQDANKSCLNGDRGSSAQCQARSAREHEKQLELCRNLIDRSAPAPTSTPELPQENQSNSLVKGTIQAQANQPEAGPQTLNLGNQKPPLPGDTGQYTPPIIERPSLKIACLVTDPTSWKSCAARASANEIDFISINESFDCSGPGSCEAVISGSQKPLTISGANHLPNPPLIRRVNSYNYPLLTITRSQNITVENILFDDVTTNKCKTCNSPMVVVSNSQLISINKINISGAKKLGIAILGGDLIKILSSSIKDSDGSGVWVSVDPSSRETLPKRISLSESTISRVQDIGIDITATESTVTNSSLSEARVGAVVRDPSSNIRFTNNFISGIQAFNNDIESGNGIVAVTEGSPFKSSISALEITNNFFGNLGGWAVFRRSQRIPACDKIEISGNTIENVACKKDGLCAALKGISWTCECPAVQLKKTVDLSPGAINVPYSELLGLNDAINVNRMFIITAGELPPGLSLERTSGSISGRPALSGTFNFSVSLIGSNLCADARSFRIKVTQTAEPPTVPPACSLPSPLRDVNIGTAGVPYSASLSPRLHRLKVVAGTLPPGFQLPDSGNAGTLVSSNPKAGIYNFSISAEVPGLNCPPFIRQYRLIINCKESEKLCGGDCVPATQARCSCVKNDDCNDGILCSADSCVSGACQFRPSPASGFVGFPPEKPKDGILVNYYCKADREPICPVGYRKQDNSPFVINASGGMQQNCELQCSTPLTACGQACVDLMVDSKNCGSCGRTCTKDQVCADGKCISMSACNLADIKSIPINLTTADLHGLPTRDAFIPLERAGSFFNRFQVIQFPSACEDRSQAKCATGFDQLYLRDGILGVKTRACVRQCRGTPLPSSLPQATRGNSYSQSLLGSGTNEYFLGLNSGTLPSGLAINSFNQISGIPRSLGTSSFEVGTLKLDNGCVSKQQYSITVR